MNRPELVPLNDNLLTHYKINKYRLMEIKSYGNDVIVRPCLLSIDSISGKFFDRIFIDINESNLREFIKVYGTPYIAKNWPAGEYGEFWGRRTI